MIAINKESQWYVYPCATLNGCLYVICLVSRPCFLGIRSKLSQDGIISNTYQCFICVHNNQAINVQCYSKRYNLWMRSHTYVNVCLYLLCYKLQYVLDITVDCATGSLTTRTACRSDLQSCITGSVLPKTIWFLCWVDVLSKIMWDPKRKPVYLLSHSVVWLQYTQG